MTEFNFTHPSFSWQALSSEDGSLFWVCAEVADKVDPGLELLVTMRTPRVDLRAFFSLPLSPSLFLEVHTPAGLEVIRAFGDGLLPDLSVLDLGPPHACIYATLLQVCFQKILISFSSDLLECVFLLPIRELFRSWEPDILTTWADHLCFFYFLIFF